MEVKITPLDSMSAGFGRPASRRAWLKGVGALLGTGLLATPAAVLAAPAAPAETPLPASALVGGDEYVGTVKLLAGTEVPQGWMPCDGRLLAVAQHPVLFALLGTTYGGDGQTTFALPYINEAAPAGNNVAPVADAARPLSLVAVKTANAPATTTALAELRLAHHVRARRTA